MSNKPLSSIPIGCAFITFDFREGSVLNFYENISSSAADKLAMKILVSGFNGSKKLEDYYGENITTITEDGIITYSYLFPMLAKVEGTDTKEPRPNALTVSFPLTEHARIYRLAPSIKNLLVDIAKNIQENFVYGQKLPEKIKENLRSCMNLDFLEKNSKVDISYISTSIPSIQSDSTNTPKFEDYYDIPELTKVGTSALIGTTDNSLSTIIGSNFKSIIKEINGRISIREINNRLKTNLDDLMVIFNLLKEKGYVSKLSENKKICIIFEELYNELATSIEGLKKGKSKKMFEEALTKENHSLFLLIRYDSHEKISFQSVIQFFDNNTSNLEAFEQVNLFLLPVNSILLNLEKFYGKNMIVNLKRNLLLSLAHNYGSGDTYSLVKINFNIDT